MLHVLESVGSAGNRVPNPINFMAKNVREIPPLVVVTNFNYRFLRSMRPKPHPSSLIPGKTLPNLSMTVNELLKRHEAGIPIPNSKVPLYEDPNVPSTGRSIKSLDLIDLQYYKKNSLERLKLLTDRVNQADTMAAERKRKRQEQYDKWVAAQEAAEKGVKEPPSTNTP